VSGEKSRRLQRAEKEIREVISTYLMQKQSGTSNDLVSLTNIVVSPDLRHVKAYVCILGKDEVDSETLEALQSHAPEIQNLFNSKFRMKYCPKVKFFNDEGVRMLAKIDAVVGDSSNQS
jgi:ribosome-binding factor A